MSLSINTSQFYSKRLSPFSRKQTHLCSFFFLVTTRLPWHWTKTTENKTDLDLSLEFDSKLTACLSASVWLVQALLCISTRLSDDSHQLRIVHRFTACVRRKQSTYSCAAEGCEIFSATYFCLSETLVYEKPCNYDRNNAVFIASRWSMELALRNRQVIWYSYSQNHSTVTYIIEETHCYLKLG